MEKEFDKAILKTLIYASIFDYPLTVEELSRFLIGYETLNTDEFEHGFQQIKSGLEQIEQSGKFVFLKGRKDLIRERKRRARSSQFKLRKAKKVASWLKFIPWIKMVAVTGAVAAGNASEDSDIDLLMTTSRNRLWLARGGEFLILTLLGQRRKPGQTRGLQDKICPNIYISEAQLTLPYQDLFTANEIARMKVLWDKGDTYQKFLKANRWLKKFLPNWWKARTSNRRNRTLKASETTQARAHWCFGNSLEKLARFAQLKYMEKRKTSETITDTLLLFHPENQREAVLKKFTQKCEQLNVPSL